MMISPSEGCYRINLPTYRSYATVTGSNVHWQSEAQIPNRWRRFWWWCLLGVVWRKEATG